MEGFGTKRGGLKKIPRVEGGDGFLYEAIDKWVEIRKFLKVW